MKRFEPIYDLISPIVKSYRSDLEIDRAEVNDNPQAEFIISARETGTHIVSMFPANDDQWPAAGEKVPYMFGTASRETILDGVVGIAEYVTNNPGQLIVHVTRHGHETIKPAEVLPIVESYKQRVRAEWSVS